jgi:K+-transporting ATPase c subunit
MTQERVPRTITLDGYKVSHRGVRELRAEDRKLSPHVPNSRPFRILGEPRVIVLELNRALDTKAKP